MMATVGPLLLTFFREAWGALVGALAILFALGLLMQTLKATTASALGTNYWAAQAISAGAGLVALALFAFLGVPAIGQAALVAIPESAGCGPLADLGALAASLVGALGGLRMLKALSAASAAAATGGASGLSRSLLEVGETLLGMLLAAAAVPIATHFLGAC
jgi:hypothetical protein